MTRLSRTISVLDHGATEHQARQTELFANVVFYLSPAYVYDLPFLLVRLPLLYSFDEPIVTQWV